MSMRRRIMRRKEKKAKRQLEASRRDMQILFGKEEAPDWECAAERHKLVATLWEWERTMRAPTAAHAWAVLVDKRAEYDVQRDGESQAMGFVDSVRALREVEKEIREEKAA